MVFSQVNEAARPLALVTGAARRLGRVIALDLARHGWDLALHCRWSLDEAEETARDVRALGARAEVFVVDFEQAQACEALVPDVVQRCGRLDAVVNNASFFEHDDLATFSVAAMERHWRVNTAPAILMARSLFDHLTARHARGCIVNLLDQKLAHPNPDYLSYTLSKAALASATLMLARALAPTVRVCGVSPGLTFDSPLIDTPTLQRLQAGTPLHQGSDPADVAAAVRFLLLNQSTTGVDLVVDAGSHLEPGSRDFAFSGLAHD